MSHMQRTTPSAAQAPHSWDLEHWPTSVYPHSENRARYLIRSQKDALVAAGALARVGRELIVMGDRYTKWLQLQSVNVPNFIAAPNRGRPTVA